MTQQIGFHVSIEGGLARSVERALDRGCTAFQIFCGSPRAWEFQPRDEAEVREFRRARAAAGLDPLCVHACYLVNPAAPDGAVFERSVGRLAAELALAEALGADFYVLDPGSQKGESASYGIERAADAVVRALGIAGSAPMVLLEGMASAHGPGGEFASLGRLIARIEARSPGARVGLAVDSCHVFGAGYDLRGPAEVERLASEVDRAVGLDRLHLLHVNDSRDAPGSRRDRHQHIGKGTIGREGLANLLRCAPFSGLPKILETPWISVAVDRRNLHAVLRLLPQEPRPATLSGRPAARR